MIEWTEELSTGVEGVDGQHRELYATVARLHAAMRCRRLEEIPSILEFLERHAREHFALEEHVMEQASYGGLEAHRAAHQGFVREYHEMCSALAQPPAPSAVLELSTWLGAWLRDHVRRMDGEMARFLRPLVSARDPERPRAR
jgi:hemerythrin